MLRTRLFLNLLPFGVILLAVGVYAIVLFTRLAQSVDTAVTENYRSIKAAQAMSLALAGIEKEAWVSAAGQGATTRVFAQEQKRFEDNLALQLKSVSLPGEKELNRQLTTNYAAFTAALARLGSDPDAASRQRLYQQQVVPGMLRLSALLEKIRDLNHRAILATSLNIQKITGEMTRLMVLGMVIALIISAFASYRLSRSILQPIQSLTRATRELGAGNLGQPVPVISRDELGQLALAFNHMAAQLQEYRHSTSEKIVRLHRTMETTLASFPDPIFVLDKDGRIDLRNPAAADLASNLHLQDSLPPRLAAIAEKTLESGENFLPHSFDEVVSFRFNGAEKFFLPRILAMRTKDDVLFGVAVVLYDV